MSRRGKLFASTPQKLERRKKSLPTTINSYAILLRTPHAQAAGRLARSLNELRKLALEQPVHHRDRSAGGPPSSAEHRCLITLYDHRNTEQSVNNALRFCSISPEIRATGRRCTVAVTGMPVRAGRIPVAAGLVIAALLLPLDRAVAEPRPTIAQAKAKLDKLNDQAGEVVDRYNLANERWKKAKEALRRAERGLQPAAQNSRHPAPRPRHDGRQHLPVRRLVPRGGIRGQR